MTLPIRPFVARSVLEPVPTPAERAKAIANAAFLENILIPAVVAGLRSDSPTYEAESKRLADRARELRRLTRDDDAGWQARLADILARAEKIAALGVETEQAQYRGTRWDPPR